MRPKIQINTEELQNTINEIENKQPDKKFSTLGELYDAVANTEWGKNLKLHPQTIKNRILELNLKHNTAKAKAGRPAMGIKRTDGVSQSKAEPIILLDANQPENFTYNGRVINKGDLIFLYKGSYYFDDKGEKVYTGERGRFIFCSVVMDGIMVRRPDELSTIYCYMGESKIHPTTGTHMEPYKIKLQKEKKVNV